MSKLLELSTDILDGRLSPDEAGPINRINFQLSSISERVAVVEAFSHCIVFETDDGLLGFDTSSVQGGDRVVSAIRDWRKAPFHTLIYTHGHIDHVGGCGAFMASAEAQGHQHPRLVGHENIQARFERYQRTDGYNAVINRRQFGQFSRRGYEVGGDNQFLPSATKAPDLTYSHQMTLDIGGLSVELNHAKGETDDHTWGWIPAHRAICAGDFFIWCFPNAGNPQKVQRYPAEWARAMRAMAEKDAELLLPAHGLPIVGEQRIKTALEDVANALEYLVSQTLMRMNEGAKLDDIIQEVRIDPAELEKPYLRPTYDEPEFVIRNIWRMYGGWYDGNPSHLKPAPDKDLALELAQLAGGAQNLADRALALASKDPRLACHLAELAVQAAPTNVTAHEIRAAVYQGRRAIETSLMAKGIYGAAANESLAVLDHGAGTD